MAKRPRLTTEDILASLSSDDDDRYSDDGDFDEPMMPGSDDEFSDCDGIDSDDESAPHSPIPHSPTGTSLTVSNSIPGSPMSSSDAGWSSTLTPVNIAQFNSPVGPTVTVPDSPLKVFELLFTTDLQSNVVNESNKYAAQVMGEERYNKWDKMAEDEFRAYLGFNILMGINKLPFIDDYWSRNPLLHYSPVADRITRDRFRDLSRYLHFADNTTLSDRGSPNHDRLGKVRPVITHMERRFKDVYKPNKEVAVDEAMIKFQGRSSLKQYMPMKPVKRGIKVWCLADSQNGFFSSFQVYTEKESNTVEKGLSKRVVKDLSTELKGKNHHVYFDNFFTRLDLIIDLEKDGIYACGTARKDRKGFPPELKKPVLSNR